MRTATRALRLAIPAALLTGLLGPAIALAQGPAAEPIDQPAEFASVRDRFEDMTPAEWEAAGYRADPGGCISSPAGGMGAHYINADLFAAQFDSATPDPANPPLLLVDAAGTRVIGLEWEAKDIGQGEMELFGAPFPLLPGHPGLTEPHHMFHAYFRPDGQVLFDVFDPMISCQIPSTSMIPESNDTSALIGLGVALLGAALASGLAVLRRRQAL